MCFKKPKMPKEQKRLIRAQLEATQEAARAEQERIAELKKQQYERSKGKQKAAGVRSMISSASGGGFGRNFFG